MRELLDSELCLVSGSGDTPTFNLTNDSDGTGRQKLDQAISYLNQSVVARAAFDSNDTVNVTIVDGTVKEGYDPNTNTIFWDPDHGITTTDANGSSTGYESAALNFFHEYYHSQDSQLSDPNNQTHFLPGSELDELGYENLNEVHAVAATNLVADNLGETERGTYSGDDVSVYSVSQNSGDATVDSQSGLSESDVWTLLGFFDNLDSSNSGTYVNQVNIGSAGDSFDIFTADGGGYDYNQPRS